jgi:DNA integrity scanning protein DisA with diadenylate cyclase activity
MENIILTTTTKNELIQELKTEILNGINDLFNEARDKDLQSKEWLNSKETENLLKISSVTLWSWSKSGILKAHKIGNRLRYRKDDVIKALIRKEPQI